MTPGNLNYNDPTAVIVATALIKSRDHQREKTHLPANYRKLVETDHGNNNNNNNNNNLRLLRLRQTAQPTMITTTACHAGQQ